MKEAEKYSISEPVVKNNFLGGGGIPKTVKPFKNASSVLKVWLRHYANKKIDDIPTSGQSITLRLSQNQEYPSAEKNELRCCSLRKTQDGTYHSSGLFLLQTKHCNL